MDLAAITGMIAGIVAIRMMEHSHWNGVSSIWHIQVEIHPSHALLPQVARGPYLLNYLQRRPATSADL